MVGERLSRRRRAIGQVVGTASLGCQESQRSMKDKLGCSRLYHAIVGERIRVALEEIKRESKRTLFNTRISKTSSRLKPWPVCPERQSLDAEGRSTSI